MTVHDNEHLARFISNEGWFNQDQVKGDAFRPSINRRGVFETSVTRHDGRNSEEIKRAGDHWATSRAKPITFFGWANVATKSVRTASLIPELNVEASSSTRDPHHANIVGWNVEYGKRLIQAEDIARQSSLFLC